ncbi:MAG: hypothetical protein NZ929_04545 [Aigarchaeota archaeon]|nr:hypothetical protein [Aigarchaeota archaeon]MCX8193537.1 hypothetical protein [Nitrososphaeria archaeon]MDW7986677.1 hypothetical protein [Nitrososphaerota archaeon]
MRSYLWWLKLGGRQVNPYLPTGQSSSGEEKKKKQKKKEKA